MKYMGWSWTDYCAAPLDVEAYVQAVIEARERAAEEAAAQADAQAMR